MFVRFIEDNGLIDEPLIGGPNRAIDRAEERQLRYFRSHPTATDRDYLLHGFAAVARLPALAMLYDRARNPVWRLGISGDAARGLLEFWRTVNPDTGVLRHDFTDPSGTPASWATCTRTCPTTPRSATPCCRRRSSSRSSSWSAR